MKQFLIQSLIIFLLTITGALVFNHFSAHSIDIFTPYSPPPPKVNIEFNPVGIEQLRDLVGSRMAVLLDARNYETYLEEHIPGAISFPIAEFDQKYDKLKTYFTSGKIIIVYCIGHGCTDSQLLGEKLFQLGHQDIFIYKEGIEGWKQRGYRVISGSKDEN